jgi:hypothetical protein
MRKNTASNRDHDEKEDDKRKKEKENEERSGRVGQGRKNFVVF